MNITKIHIGRIPHGGHATPIFMGKYVSSLRLLRLAAGRKGQRK